MSQKLSRRDVIKARAAATSSFPKTATLQQGVRAGDGQVILNW